MNQWLLGLLNLSKIMIQGLIGIIAHQLTSRSKETLDVQLSKKTKINNSKALYLLKMVNNTNRQILEFCKIESNS
jgi:hypothetical protein